jgi:hypothetical protein
MAYCSVAKHTHPAALDTVVTTLGIPRLSELPLSNRNAGSLQIHFCFLGCLNVSAAAVLPCIRCVAYGHDIHKPKDTLYLVRCQLNSSLSLCFDISNEGILTKRAKVSQKDRSLYMSE